MAIKRRTKEDRFPDNQKLRAAIDELIKERNFQMLRWTPEHDGSHTPSEWLSILSVYMGKAAAECKPYKPAESKAAYRKRVRQVGAICMAILEATED